VPPKLTGFRIIDGYDPAEMDERSHMSQRLPARHGVHTYTLRDPAQRRARADGSLLTRHAGRQTGGDLMLGYAYNRFGTEIGIIEPGLPAYCFRLRHFILSTTAKPRVLRVRRFLCSLTRNGVPVAPMSR
jgi:hypothetical protein